MGDRTFLELVDGTSLELYQEQYTHTDKYGNKNVYDADDQDDEELKYLLSLVVTAQIKSN